MSKISKATALGKDRSLFSIPGLGRDWGSGHQGPLTDLTPSRLILETASGAQLDWNSPGRESELAPSGSENVAPSSFCGGCAGQARCWVTI